LAANPKLFAAISRGQILSPSSHRKNVMQVRQRLGYHERLIACATLGLLEKSPAERMLAAE
jgi:hypothetical protein